MELSLAQAFNARNPTPGSTIHSREMHMKSSILRGSVLGLLLLPMSSAAPHQDNTFSGDTPTALWWIDLDGDGLLDALSIRPTGKIGLLHNNGAGGFDDHSEAPGLVEIGGVRQVLPRDIDGDGLPELFLTIPLGQSRLLRNDGNNTFSELSSLGLELSSVRHARWLDFDADGMPDLHLSTSSGELLHRNLGKGAFESIDLGQIMNWDKGDAPTDSPEDQIAPIQSSHDSLPGPGAGPESQLLALNCALSLLDIATGNCLQASSSPILGALYPLSQELFVTQAGRVGIGTLSPAEQLDVIGNVRAEKLIASASTGAPIQVSSDTLVPNLNAELLDGFSATDFSQLGSFIDASEIAALAISTGSIQDLSVTSPKLADGAIIASKLAGNIIASGNIINGAVSHADLSANSVDSGNLVNNSIVDQDISSAAAIQGTKIAPNFGSQDIITTGNVGIGTNSPQAALHAEDPSLFTGGDLLDPAVKASGSNGPTTAHLGTQGTTDFDGNLNADWSGLEIGVAGISNGSSNADNFGVLGHSNGIGVRGEHSADPSMNFGELGVQNIGVLASGLLSGVQADSPIIGVQGSGDLYGVYGISAAAGGRGVFGTSTAGAGDTGYGVRGESSAEFGTGVSGEAYSSVGSGAGVRGTTGSSIGYGVRGTNNGSTTGTRRVGVYGTSDGGNGVRGFSSGSGADAVGVYGTATAGSYGVFSLGDFGATGTKAFLQPHPTDPAKQIRFVALEGNEAGTYFRGSVRLAGGTGVIDVPEEFRLVTEAEGLTISLTAIGAPAIVWSSEPDLNQIVISGNQDVRVDYQVHGFRRGFKQIEIMGENRHFVPRSSGSDFSTHFPEGLLQILVENGTLNPDFSTNEVTAARMGWKLGDLSAIAAREAAASSEQPRLELERERLLEVNRKADSEGVYED